MSSIIRVRNADIVCSTGAAVRSTGLDREKFDVPAAFGSVREGLGTCSGTARSTLKTLTGDPGERRLSSAQRNHPPPVLVITAEYDPPRKKDEFCAGKLRTAH